MGIVRAVMDVYPWAWVFFIPFIITTSFAVLNPFSSGIIVSAMQEETEETAMAERGAMHRRAGTDHLWNSGRCAKK